MRLGRVALYAVAGLVGLLLLALIVLLNTDLGRFKHSGEDLVSELLGRQFVIDGPLHASIGRKIEVDAENLRLAATEWSAEPDLVTVRRVTARVDTWSLVSGPIRIESLEIDGVRVALETREDGADNWTLAAAGEAPEPVDEDLSRPQLPVLLDDAKITDVHLSFNSPVRPQPLVFRGQLGAGTYASADALQLHIDGAINDTPVTIEATAGPVPQLIDFRAVTFTLAASLGEIELNGNAAVADLWQPAQPSMTLTLSGPNAEYLTGILDLEPITTGPLALRASVGPVGERMQIGLNGAFGEFALDASGHFDSLRSLAEIELRVAASGPDARTVGALLGMPQTPQDPFNIVGNVTRSGNDVSIDQVAIVIGKSRLDVKGHFGNFPDPNEASLTLNITGPDFGRFNALFGLPGKLTGPFNVDATIKPASPSGAAIEFAAEAQDLQITAVGSITDAENYAGTTLRLRAAGPDLRTVATAGGLATAPAEAFDVALQLDRIGEGLRLSEGTVSIGTDRATFSGFVGDKPLEAATDVSFALAGPNLAKSLIAFGVDADELPYARYEVNGRIERGADGFLLHGLRAAVGERLDYELTVDGLITDAADYVGSQLAVNAHGASLGALAAAGGVAGIPFNASAELRRVENGFIVKEGRAKIGDDLFTLEGLVGAKPLERDTDIRFSATAANLKGTLAALGTVVEALPPGKLVSSGSIRSRGDYFSLNNMSTTFAGAKIDLAGRVGSFPTLNGTDLTLRVSGADLSRVLPPMDAIRALDKPFSLDTMIRLKGDVLRVDDLRFKVDDTSLSADFETAMKPTLGRGRFSITADSPDILRLVPKMAEVSVVESDPLTLRAGGKWAGDLWTFDELFLMLGKGTLTVKGSIDRPPDFDRTDLSFNLDVASLRNLSLLARRELPADSAHLEFRLDGTREAMTLQDFAGTFGDSDIAGSFVWRDTGKTDLDATFTSRRLNLAPYLPEPGDEPEKPAPSGEKKTRVIPDTPLPMDKLANIEASVNFNFGEVVLKQRSIENVVLEASVHDGVLLVSKFSLANTVGGSLSGALRLRPLDGGGDLLLDVQGAGLTMALPAETPEELAALPKFDLDTVLAGKGRTVRELAGSLGGYVRLTGGEGQIRASAMRFLANDFLFELMNTLNPFTKSDTHTAVKCTAALLAANDGVISGKPAAVLQTDRIQIFASTTIDLKTEKLDADIKTVPQKGLGVSFTDLVNPYTKLSGTLANPLLILDPKGALVEGGAAIATGGISFLAMRFKDRFLSAKDQCGKAVEDANADFAALREKYRPGSSKPK
ncbi:MAG: AsmA family protein [Gammaproteobacteria bacterium]|nr:AsmA family protein [Gammaproteobacteria bacterium]